MTALDRFFASYYRLRPVNATFTGVHAYDDRLPDWSPEGIGAAIDEMRAVRTALASEGAAGAQPSAGGATSRDPLDDVEVRDRALAASCLDVQLAELGSVHFQQANPSLALGEAIFGLVSLMTRPFAPAADRADSAAARLAGVPAFLAGARRSVSAPGIPAAWRARALRECEGGERLFRDGIPRWIAGESFEGTSAARLRTAADRALRALLEFRGWLDRELPDSEAPGGCGPELFDLLLERGHWTGRSRADLQAEARDALDGALARLHDMADRIAPGGWPEVQARLADQHPSAADYLSTFQRIWDECRARAERLDLVAWPDAPIRYVPIPPQTRDAAPYLYYLFYRSPAPFDRLPVHEYSVTPVDGDLPAEERARRLRAANFGAIKLNHVVHHGAIGHHVQNYYAYHGPSAIGRVAAVDCASRIGMFLGGTMAEGWACYATDLMDEAGFLTPDESAAQQHTRARLLARAVADIGLHEGSMTFAEAVALYRDRIGMPAEAARAEACRNSMFPGTAVMYWLGTDALHALRRRTAAAWGDAFSLRRFHDRVLAFGSIPVPLIARLMA
jgi:hypothetical protein